MFRFASTCLALLGVLFSAGASAGASAWAGAASVVDDRGVTVSLEQPAQRVAAVSTFGADLLLALDQLPVAVTRFGPFSYPDYLGSQLAQVPVIGTRAQVNMELLSQAGPDLILAIRRYTEQDASRFEQIAPMLALDLITLEDSLRAVTGAGELLGQAARAKQLNDDFQALVERYAAQAPGDLSAALLVTGAEAPFIYHDHFLTAGLLRALKVDNLGGPAVDLQAGVPLGYRIRLETLLERDPDVIFLFDSNHERAFTRNPIWPYLSAVRNGRVYEVGQQWKEAAGPLARRLVFEEMAHLLYPTLFPQPPEVPASLRARVYAQAQP